MCSCCGSLRAIVFIIVTTVVRRFLSSGRPVPTGFMSALEAVVLYVRDEMVQPNVGRKWVNTWTPLLLTLFVFIFSANAIGLIPLFDVVALLDHYVLHTGSDSFLKNVVHGGTTATANFNVTAALATITFGAIIVAGTKAHGFIKHWKNLVPHGLAWPIYILLIPDRDHGAVRASVRAHDATCGQHDGRPHRYSRDSVVRVPVRGVVRARSPESESGMVVSVPLAVGISALEIIVVLVQAYVFTLLTAVFIGMAIHVHH